MASRPPSRSAPDATYAFQGLAERRSTSMLDLGLLIEGGVAGVGSAQDSPDAAPQSASSA